MKSFTLTQDELDEIIERRLVRERRRLERQHTAERQHQREQFEREIARLQQRPGPVRWWRRWLSISH